MSESSTGRVAAPHTAFKTITATGPRVWALCDERAGNRSQVLGVAEALGFPFERREIRYGPGARLPNLVLGAALAPLTTESRAGLGPPWPDIVIGAGRRAAPVMRALKRAGGDQGFIVQLMDPGRPRRGLDLIAAPLHDGVPRSANVIATVGAAHRVTADGLAAARATWAALLEHLPRPRIAVLVGGPTKRRAFTRQMARALAAAVSRMAEQAGGSLLVSTSRRTGPAEDDLIAGITVPHHGYRYRDAGANPYMGYLALADAVVVTGESASMCTEACATEGPVYIYAPPGFVIEKHTRLHQFLFEKGLARPFDGSLEPWVHPPVNSAGAIAEEVLKRLALS